MFFLRTDVVLDKNEYTVIVSRKIYNKLHLLHGVVLSDQMKYQTSKYDAFQCALERTVTALEKAPTTFYESNRQVIKQCPINIPLRSINALLTAFSNYSCPILRFTMQWPNILCLKWNYSYHWHIKHFIPIFAASNPRRYPKMR